MSSPAIFVMIIVVSIPLWGYVGFRYGEPYSKRRMQGPFVPLTSEEIASDEARKLLGDLRQAARRSSIFIDADVCGGRVAESFQQIGGRTVRVAE